MHLLWARSSQTLDAHGQIATGTVKVMMFSSMWHTWIPLAQQWSTYSTQTLVLLHVWYVRVYVCVWSVTIFFFSCTFSPQIRTSTSCDSQSIPFLCPFWTIKHWLNPFFFPFSLFFSLLLFFFHTFPYSCITRLLHLRSQRGIYRYLFLFTFFSSHPTRILVEKCLHGCRTWLVVSAVVRTPLKHSYHTVVIQYISNNNHLSKWEIMCLSKLLDVAPRVSTTRI